jgi:hypothetical protein
MVWITEEKNPTDVFLKPGQPFEFSGTGIAIVEAIGQVVLSLTWNVRKPARLSPNCMPAPSRPPRTPRIAPRLAHTGSAQSGADGSHSLDAPLTPDVLPHIFNESQTARNARCSRGQAN